MARLQGALDNEVHIAVQRFLEDGVSTDVDALYTAIQRSNSSLKRRPKKLLQSSIERVLEFLDIADSSDSEAAIEKSETSATAVPDAMNRSLRMNLAAPSSPQPVNGDDARRRQRLPNGEPVLKRKKVEAATTVAAASGPSLDEIGGMDQVLDQLEEALVWPLMYPEEFEAMQVKLPSGILLHGPPGCGKTMISRAFASAMGLPFVDILGPSIVSGMSGESEKAIREKFDEAKRNAPCLIFMDEIDAIAPKRDTSQSQMEKRIVAQLLVSMDELERDTSKPVIVLATTNRPDSLDPALRRGGRFDREINIGVPNEQVRQSILQAQTRKMPLDGGVDLKKLAKMTAGFVGADLADLVKKAGAWQLKRYFTALKTQMREQQSGMDYDPTPQDRATSIMSIINRRTRTDLDRPPGFEDRTLGMDAFLAVYPTITPSSKREGFATIPDVSWNDIGALEDVRKELQQAIVEPIKNPEKYEALKMTTPAGVLLWGPPGCGKTLLAKAAAAESKANFISVKGPELINKFVGESEAAVRRVFTRARSSVPCVIFFDELDALVPKRDDQGSEASSRVVNTLLTELDGLDDREGIHIIGATNRPDMIDDAMLRPGRLGTALFVDLPGPTERAAILRALVRGKPIGDLEKIAQIAHDRCEGYSGADLGALLREAGQFAILRDSKLIEPIDFEHASGKVTGSVGNMERYYRLKKRFRNK